MQVQEPLGSSGSYSAQLLSAFLSAVSIINSILVSQEKGGSMKLFNNAIFMDVFLFYQFCLLPVMMVIINII